MSRRQGLFVVCFLCLTASAAAQPSPRDPGSDIPPTLRVFIDCRGGCDGVFIRTELAFLDHVTEREAADVHILITTRGAGSGGTAYSIAFIGLGRFEAIQDAAVYTTQPTDSFDDVRTGLVRTLKLGLVRYIALTPLRDALDISVQAPRTEERRPAAHSRDPWDSWVFRVRGNVDSSGEESSSAIRLSGGASASRVTEAWKTAINTSANYRRNRYDLEEGDEDYVSVTRDSWVSVVLIRSLGGRWGGGLRASTSTSTYSNQNRTFRGGPAVEFNWFPYAESTRRQLTLRYAVGLNYFDYEEPTIYGKLDETLMGHSLAVDLDLRQPWGQLGLEALASQFLPDTNKNRLSLEANLDVRLFKGFSLAVGADTSRIRDQIFLPADDATDAEILLRQRQIATSYDFRFSVGFSYSFGSVYNNVVNTRLAGY